MTKMTKLEEAQAEIDAARHQIVEEGSFWANPGWWPRMKAANARLEAAQLKRELALTNERRQTKPHG